MKSVINVVVINIANMTQNILCTQNKEISFVNSYFIKLTSQINTKDINPDVIMANGSSESNKRKCELEVKQTTTKFKKLRKSNKKARNLKEFGSDLIFVLEI